MDVNLDVAVAVGDVIGIGIVDVVHVDIGPAVVVENHELQTKTLHFHQVVA